MNKKAIAAWSSGKDSALALYEIKQSGEYEVVSLLSILVDGDEKIGMHNVPCNLVKKQSESLGIPLEIIRIHKHDSAEYEIEMRRLLESRKEQGVQAVIFGDVCLEELRAERERKLKDTGLKGIFPLWKRSSREIVEEFVNRGFRAVITNVDSQCMSTSHLGNDIDQDFIRRAPSAIDICGENGEYHSFVYDGPIFSNIVEFHTGISSSVDGRFYQIDIHAGRANETG
jgi:uncharacterized protein (TIGR00290 family)